MNLLRKPLLALLCLLCAASAARAQEVALTFDDLPVNGALPPGVTKVQMTRDVVAILRKHHLPPAYGFVNAGRLEGDPDGAAALKLWVASGQKVGSHTYLHIDLNANPVEAFEKEINLNEPALELLEPDAAAWHWFRYPYLREGDTLEKRNAVRAYLKVRGYQTAQVTLDYEDYLWNTAYAHCAAKGDQEAIAWLHTSYLQFASEYLDKDREMATLVAGRPIRHVLLLHLGAFSKVILPDLLDLLKQKGFKIVPLERAQQDSIYQLDPAQVSQWGGSLLDQLMDQKKLTYPAFTKKPYQKFQTMCQ